MPGPSSRSGGVLLDQTRLLTTLRRYALLVVAITLLSAAAAGVYGTGRPDVYPATAQIQVGRSPTAALLDRQGSDVDVRVSQATAVSLLQSNALFQVVLAKLGEAEPLDASTVPDSRIVDLYSEAGSPEAATLLLKTYVDEYLGLLRRTTASGLEQAEGRLRGELQASTAALRELDLAVAAAPAATRDAVQAGQAARRDALEAEQSRTGETLQRVVAARAAPDIGARLATPPLPGFRSLTRGWGSYALLGGLLGLTLAVGLVLVLQARDGRLREVADVRRRVGDRHVAVLGRSASWVLVEQPQGRAAGTWRALLTQAVHGTQRGPLLVVPAGQSSPAHAAVELAAALAEDQDVVVLADLGGTAPDVCTLVGLPRAPGLQQVLREGVDLGRALRPAPALPALRVIGSGLPEEAQDGLTASAPDRLVVGLAGVDELARRRAAVVLCGPAVHASGAASAAAAMSTAVVVVVVLGVTLAEELETTLSDLEQLGDTRVCVVVTRPPARRRTSGPAQGSGGLDLLAGAEPSTTPGPDRPRRAPDVRAGR